MSATEIIEQIKVLTPAQQAEVASFLRGLETRVVREDQVGGGGRGERFQKAADHVFTEYRDVMGKLAQ